MVTELKVRSSLTKPDPSGLLTLWNILRLFMKMSFQFSKEDSSFRHSLTCSSEFLMHHQLSADGRNAAMRKHYEGKSRAMVSLVSRVSLSGNFTSNSTIKSPRRSGLLGRGRPSPVMRRFIPGRTMTSCSGMGTMRLSNVGTFTVQPQRA